jgi:two-component system response regulator NreC
MEQLCDGSGAEPGLERAAHGCASGRTDGRTRLLIAANNCILREGLGALIASEAGLEVVSKAGSSLQACASARETRPDVIIADLELPGAAGEQTVRDLRSCCPVARVLVLTIQATEDCIRAAFLAGASGLVLKDATTAELVHGIRVVASGQWFLSNRAAAHVVRSYLDERGAETSTVARVTTREREVLTLIARGESNKKIARSLNRSVKTVEKHRANLMRKLGLHNVADVTRFALQNHML